MLMPAAGESEAEGADIGGDSCLYCLDFEVVGYQNQVM